MNKLIIADDEGKTTVVPLVRDEITIGRKEGNTIRLTERNVSRRHARLVRKNGSFLLEDLESYNGVKVNGDPIGQTSSLKDGDRITIGDYQLSLRSDRPAPGPKIGGEPQAEPPPYPRLVMLGPPSPGEEFALDEGELVIGRTDENAIVINHRSISRSHAKVILSEAGCRLIDLDSANGVRVNGADYSDVELNPGDLVELGTVRLRYVGAREAYQFDADATVQMDAVPEEMLADLDQRKSALPIIIAIAVVAVVAIGVAIAVIMSGGDDPVEGGDGVAVEPGGGGTTATAGVSTSPSEEDQLSRANDLFTQGLFNDVIPILDKLGPNEAAQKLRSRTIAEMEAQKRYRKACAPETTADLETTHINCKTISADSRYFEKGCCKMAASNFGRSKLESARSLADQKQLAKAISLGQSVQEDHEMPQSVRDEAARLIESWQKQGEPSEPQTKVASTGPRKVRRGGDTPRRDKQRERPEPAATSPAASGSAVERARQAAINNDQRGCINALKGAPRTSRVVSLLLTCYQQAGNHRAACALAKQYPGARGARQLAASPLCNR